MTLQPAAVVAGDPSSLTLHFQHTAQFLDVSALEIWEVQISADGKPVGSLRAIRGLHCSGGGAEAGTDAQKDLCSEAGEVNDLEESWPLDEAQEAQLDNLRSQLSAQGGFCALVAEQLLSDDAVGLRDWGSLNVLVFDQLSLSAPWDDPLIAAAVAASVVDWAAAGAFLVIFPAGTAAEGADAALLEAAGRLLWAEPPVLSDDLCFLDTKFDQGEGVAEVRELLLSRVRR